MAYDPSIHTASNKPYGVTGMPVDARYWYYDSATFEYRAYANTAEVLAYLIGDDRKGATVQIGSLEYWWPNSNDLTDSGLAFKGTKKSVDKLGSNIDAEGFIDVSASVSDAYDLIGVYVNMLPVNSAIFFDHTNLKVGPFDTSISGSTPILLRFI